MQRLVKRVAQAQRQASRQGRKQAAQQNIDMMMRNRSALRAAVSEVRQNLMDARQARKDAWELGPLAPKLDIGTYGTIQSNVRQDWSNGGFNQPRPEVIEKRCAWAGGKKQLNLAVKDRVVILDGPDKGKVGQIKSIQPDAGTVLLEDHNKALADPMFDNPVRAQSMPISIASIRLVYPITNPETGITRDVVINQLKAVPPNMQSANMSIDRWQYGNKWDRLVPGINVIIPWPEVEVPEFETFSADTARDTAEERSFYYSLLSPPMPEQILDELRNKYSKFRTRHEAWYVEKKEAQEAAKKGYAEAIKSMQTPLDEFHELQREIRDSRGEPELSEEMLEKLGAIMAQKKAQALSQAGAEEVTPPPPSSSASGPQ